MRTAGVMPDDTFALRYPDYVTSILLSTSAQAIAVPSTLGATRAFFASEANFAVAYGSSVGAVTAAFTTATSTGCELNPAVRSWAKGAIAELSIIGRSSGYMSIAFFNEGST